MGAGVDYGEGLKESLISVLLFGSWGWGVVGGEGV